MTRRDWLFSTSSALLSPRSLSRSFWLFPLLRPERIRISPLGIARLHCSDARRDWIVEGAGSAVDVHLSSPPLQVAGPADQPVWLHLQVPGCMERDFFGSLAVRSDSRALEITLTAPLEVATNCIVGAELPAAVAHPAALAAQAIVSRSVLSATRDPRHACAWFCDTTHCQFFRSPALSGSPVSEAVRGTQSVVMVQDGRPIAPRYSAACGGKTEAGFNSGARYAAVRCETCRRRGLKRTGHGWGLCQEGAMALAAAGASYREILDRYFPDADLTTIRCA